MRYLFLDLSMTNVNPALIRVHQQNLLLFHQLKYIIYIIIIIIIPKLNISYI